MEFKPTMDGVEDELDINMNCVDKGDHIPQTKKNNTTLKNRIRMKYY